MAENLDNLEREIEAGLARLGPDLDEPLPEAVRRNVGMRVRTALNEAWLAERVACAPPAGTLARVRAGIHTELRKQTRLRRIWRAVSVGAAAAMVLFCIGLVHHVTLLQNAANSAEMVELFVAAGDQVVQEDNTSTIQDDLARIEDGVAHVAGERDQLEDGLDSLGEEIEELEESNLTL